MRVSLSSVANYIASYLSRNMVSDTDNSDISRILGLLPMNPKYQIR